MDLYSLCAAFGFACIVYAVARLLNLVAMYWEANGDKHRILSHILAVLSVLLYICSIPAAAVFGFLRTLSDDLKASKRERNLRDLRLLIDIAQKKRSQQIHDAETYFHYSVDDPADFDFKEFASHVYEEMGL